MDAEYEGEPRLYCSLECRQMAISRQGNPKRGVKLRKRIAKGFWTYLSTKTAAGEITEQPKPSLA